MGAVFLQILSRAGVVGLSLASVVSEAASLHVERFDADVAGWTLEGQFSYDAAQSNILLQVPAAPPPPTPPQPGFGRLKADSVFASGGAFSGDFVGQDGRVLGFSLLAESLLPASLELRWSSGSNSFAIALTDYVESVGVWHHFTVSLASADAGPWLGSESGVFESSLGNVDLVQIAILSNSSVAAHRFRIDDIHLSSIPFITDLSPGAVSHQLTITNLQPGLEYQVLTRNLSTDTENVVSNFTADTELAALSLTHGGSADENYLLRFNQ